MSKVQEAYVHDTGKIRAICVGCSEKLAAAGILKLRWQSPVDGVVCAVYEFTGTNTFAEARRFVQAGNIHKASHDGH